MIRWDWERAKRIHRCGEDFFGSKWLSGVVVSVSRTVWLVGLVPGAYPLKISHRVSIGLILICRPSGMRSLSSLTNYTTLVVQNRLGSPGFETQITIQLLFIFW